VKTILREQLLEHLVQLSSVIDRYASGDPYFVEKAIDWISDVEATLSRFRQRDTSLLAAQRGMIQASYDGYYDPALDAAQTSKRKAVRATTAACLARVESAVRTHVQVIDDSLEPLRLKMAQLISVASAVEPIPLPPTEPRTEWVKQVWSGLNVNGEMKPMHSYIAASLSPVDRLFILDELLRNLLDQKSQEDAA
jgi:hypothetical protein